MKLSRNNTYQFKNSFKNANIFTRHCAYYKRELHLNQFKAQQEQAEKTKTKNNSLMRHSAYYTPTGVSKLLWAAI